MAGAESDLQDELALEAPAQDDVAFVTQRELYGAMSMKELRARAKESGASAAQLENAADSEDPKTAYIEVILEPRPDPKDGDAKDARPGEPTDRAMPYALQTALQTLQRPSVLTE